METVKTKILAVTLSALFFSSCAVSQVAYSVVKVPGTSAYSPIAVNDSGQVLVNNGSSASDQVSTWNRTSGAQAIGLVGTNSAASGINNSGDVVGAGDPDGNGDDQAFIWRPSSGVQWLGTLGGGLSAASGLNDAGAVIGFSYTATNKQHAFFWTQSDGMQDLTPNLTNVSGATAMAVNSSNMVAGYYFPDGSLKTLGFTWTAANGFQNLGPAGTMALAVNDSGAVVGQWPSASGNKHAFLWTQAGGITDLGSLGGESLAQSINNSGWVVGTSLATTGKGLLHGFLWTPAAGMQDFTMLAGLIPSEQVSSAQVNDLGAIAISTNKGGYLLLPKVLGNFSSSANPSVVGQPVTFTANLNSISGPPTDGEKVAFTVSGKLVATVALKGGVAQFTTSSLTAGAHVVLVNYPGDASHVAVKYTALTQVVTH